MILTRLLATTALCLPLLAFADPYRTLTPKDKGLQSKALGLSSWVADKKKEIQYDSFAQDKDESIIARVSHFDSDGEELPTSVFTPVVVDASKDRGKLVVLYSSKKSFDNSYALEFNSKLELVRETKIPRPYPYPYVGGFTRSDSGEYFILYGKNNKSDRFDSNIKLVRYSSDFKVQKELDLDTGVKGFNVLAPFSSANSRILYARGKIGIKFGRIIYKLDDGIHHQASLFVQVDAKDMKVDQDESRWNTASHSFAQHLIHDGKDFVHLDLGDWGPRAISLTKNLDRRNVYTFTAPNGVFYSTENEVFTEVAGLAASAEGYAVAGVSRDAIAYSGKKTSPESRLFFLKVAKNFTDRSSDFDGEIYRIRKDIVTSKGEDSEIFSFKDKDDQVRKQQNVGVKWLSAPDRKLVNPKLIALGEKRFGLLYTESSSERSKHSLFYLEVDADGTVTQAEKKIAEFPFMQPRTASTLSRMNPINDLEALWDYDNYVWFGGRIVWFRQLLNYGIIETKEIMVNSYQP